LKLVPNEIIGTIVLKLQQMMKFVYLFSISASLPLIWCTNMTRQLKIFVCSLLTYRQSVLNTDPKHDSLHVPCTLGVKKLSRNITHYKWCSYIWLRHST